MFGYATDETPELMPLPIALAHRLARRLSAVRKDGSVPYLRPDGKTQVTVVYEDDQPVAVDTVVVSSQHAEDISIEQLLTPDIKELVVEPELAALGLPTDGYRLLVNPTGKFVIGGPMGDAGLTGRKIIVDTYGGMARHGGGAFSGKDPSKVDRSGAYAMRWVAKNVVAAGLARRCEVQVAYAIGAAHPVGLFVETFGTGTVADDVLEKAITTVFDLRPGAIVRDLDLLRPIYAPTAAYGHFGRTDVDLPVGAAGPRRGAARRPRASDSTDHATAPPSTTRAPRTRRGWPGSSSTCPWRTWTGPFDYAVPDEVRRHSCRPAAGCGCGSTAGWSTASSGSSATPPTSPARSQPLSHVPSGEPVLTPQVARLVRTVADRYAGTMSDVLRLALPPRRGRRREAADADPRRAARAARPGRLRALPGRPGAARRRWPRAQPARAVWTALPGEDWPARLVELCRAALSGRRGALVVVPDGKDLDRVAAAAGRLLPEHSFTVLRADDSPEKRYRRSWPPRGARPRWCSAPGRRCSRRSATSGWWSSGTTATTCTPRPLAPYPHARDVLVQRAWLDNCAAVVAGHAAHRRGRAAGGVRAGRTSWSPTAPALRAAAPRVQALGDDFELARDPAARSARLPSLAHEAARRALAAGHAGAGAGAPPRATCRRWPAPAAARRPAARTAPARWASRRARARAARGSRPAAGAPGRRRPSTARTATARSCAPRWSGSRGRPRSSARAFPGATVRTSGQHLRACWPPCPAGPALVVATPGAEPVAEGGYGAALLLDSWALLGRADLRAGEETLRRWLNAAALVRPASAGGHVVVAADAGAPRRPGAGALGPGLAGRPRAGRPARARASRRSPGSRLAAGSPAALAEFLEALRLPEGADLLGPGAGAAAARPGGRAGALPGAGAARARGSRWPHALTEVQGVRSAKKVAEHVRVQLDPLDLV